MSTDQVSAALAGVLDALTLVQEQLHALTESSQRMEATHTERSCTGSTRSIRAKPR